MGAGVLFTLMVLGLWIGTDAQNSGLYDEEFTLNETLEPLSKQPIVYRDLPFECVDYTVQTASASSKKSARLLAYMQTKDQYSMDKEDRADEYVEGSVCTSGNCSFKVRLSKEAAMDPFYLVLVNARHTEPLQETPANETVDVKVIVKSCDQPTSEPESPGSSDGTIKPAAVIDGGNENGDKDDGVDDKLIIILVCTIGGFFIVVFILAYCRKNRKRYTKNEYGYPEKVFTPSDNGAPLADHQPQEPDSPAGGIEDPVPPPAYEPPARDSPVSARGEFSVQKEKPVSAAPTRVFNNSLWGRLKSKRGSVKLQTIGTYAERQGANIHVPSHGQDVESQAWPAAEGSKSTRQSAEVSDGEVPRPIFPEEELGDPKKNVFFNSVFSRVRSGFQGSFKSFTSFGDRGDRNSGVKLRSITSMFRAKGKNLPAARTGPEAISEGLERSSSGSSARAQYTPDKLSVVAEDHRFPGAEHLDLSSDEENTSPFATPEVQTVAASYIHE